MSKNLKKKKKSIKIAKNLQIHLFFKNSKNLKQNICGNFFVVDIYILSIQILGISYLTRALQFSPLQS